MEQSHFHFQHFHDKLLGSLVFGSFTKNGLWHPNRLYDISIPSSFLYMFLQIPLGALCDAAYYYFFFMSLQIATDMSQYVKMPLKML